MPGYLAATGMRKAASAEHQRAVQQVRLATARVFYGLLTAGEAIRVSTAGVEMAQHQLVLAQRQVDAGLVDRRIVLQAELGLARARRDLLRAEEQSVSARQSFHRMTGLPSDSSLEVPEPPSAPADLEEAVLMALEKRSDVDAAQHRVRAMKRQRLSVDLGWAPTVDLYFAEVYNQVPGFIDNNWQWQLGLNFNWDLFDGGLRIHQSRERASQVRQAMLLVDQVREQVEFDVRIGWEKHQHAEAALASVEKEVILAKENLRLAELGFKTGTATWLDVENARIGLAGAELALATERMNRDLAALELLLATGKL
jgi:outer membrane protein TolC